MATKGNICFSLEGLFFPFYVDIVIKSKGCKRSYVWLVGIHLASDNKKFSLVGLSQTKSSDASDNQSLTAISNLDCTGDLFLVKYIKF